MIGIAGIVLAESFGNKRFKNILTGDKAKEVWIELQQSTAEKTLPSSDEAVRKIQVVFDQWLNLRTRIRLFGPGILLLAGTVNIFVATSTKNYGHLAPASILLLFGISYAIINVQKICTIYDIQNQLESRETV